MATAPKSNKVVPTPAGPMVVVRKEIRAMPKAEQQRFLEALKLMMQNVDGPQSSEYFRLAGAVDG